MNNYFFRALFVAGACALLSAGGALAQTPLAGPQLASIFDNTAPSTSGTPGTGIFTQPTTTPTTTPAPVAAMPTAPINQSQIVPGATNSSIQALQQFLTLEGFAVPSTGYFGPLTQQALGRYQVFKGLSPSSPYLGTYGPWTSAMVAKDMASGSSTASCTNSYTLGSITADANYVAFGHSIGRQDDGSYLRNRVNQSTAKAAGGSSIIAPDGSKLLNVKPSAAGATTQVSIYDAKTGAIQTSLNVDYSPIVNGLSNNRDASVNSHLSVNAGGTLVAFDGIVGNVPTGTVILNTATGKTYALTSLANMHGGYLSYIPLYPYGGVFYDSVNDRYGAAEIVIRNGEGLLQAGNGSIAIGPVAVSASDERGWHYTGVSHAIVASGQSSLGWPAQMDDGADTILYTTPSGEVKAVSASGNAVATISDCKVPMLSGGGSAVACEKEDQAGDVSEIFTVTLSDSSKETITVPPSGASWTCQPSDGGGSGGGTGGGGSGGGTGGSGVCTSNSQCPNGEACQLPNCAINLGISNSSCYGVCRPSVVGTGGGTGSCQLNTDCASGQVCIYGACAAPSVGKCVSNSDCPSGQSCQEGQCVASSCTATPAAPQGFSATTKLSGSTYDITLNWTASSDATVTAYQLGSSTDNVNFNISDFPASSHSYFSRGIPLSTTYYFTLSAKNSCGASATASLKVTPPSNSSCASDTDCASGQTCVSGACVASGGTGGGQVYDVCDATTFTCKETTTPPVNGQEVCSPQEAATGATCWGKACTAVSDCGTGGYQGEKFCQANSVTQWFVAYGCSAASTRAGTCSNSVIKSTLQMCSGGQICSHGACVTPGYGICSGSKCEPSSAPASGTQVSCNPAEVNADGWSATCANQITKQNFCSFHTVTGGSPLCLQENTTASSFDASTGLAYQGHSDGVDECGMPGAACDKPVPVTLHIHDICARDGSGRCTSEIGWNADPSSLTYLIHKDDIACDSALNNPSNGLNSICTPVTHSACVMDRATYAYTCQKLPGAANGREIACNADGTCGSFGSETPPATTLPPIILGQTSDQIKALQQFLGVIPTGYFGPLTKQALGRFQVANGIVPDISDPAYGVYGPKTNSLITQLQAQGQTSAGTTSTVGGGLLDNGSNAGGQTSGGGLLGGGTTGTGTTGGIFSGTGDNSGAINALLAQIKALQAQLQLMKGGTPTPVTTTPNPYVPPSIPDGLAVTAISSSQASLSWNAASGSAGIASYKVYRNGVLVATIPATTYQDSGLTGSTTYAYTVSSQDLRGTDSGKSASVSITTPAAANPTAAGVPIAPTNPVVSNMLDPTNANGSMVSLKISWDAASGPIVTSYKIERSSDGLAFAQVGTMQAPQATYYDTGLTAGTLYYYRVRASNGYGDSPYSKIVSGRTASPVVVVQIPAVPSSLTATATSSREIDLSWTEASGDVTAYSVERSTDAAFTNITKTVAYSTTYNDTSATGIVAGTTYYYRISAGNSAGSSGYSNIASATPAATTTITASPLSVGQFFTRDAVNSNSISFSAGPTASDHLIAVAVEARASSYGITPFNPYVGTGNAPYYDLNGGGSQNTNPPMFVNVTASHDGISGNLTWVPGSTAIANGAFTEIWYALAPNSGQTSITVTLAQPADYLGVAYWYVSGAFHPSGSALARNGQGAGEVGHSGLGGLAGPTVGSFSNMLGIATALSDGAVANDTTAGSDNGFVSARQALLDSGSFGILSTTSSPNGTPIWNTGPSTGVSMATGVIKP